MPKRVLLYEHNVDGTVGGSHFCALEICRHLDRERYQPVACFAQDNALTEEFRRAGAEVLVVEPFAPARFGAHPGPGAPMLGLLQSLVNAYRYLFVSSQLWRDRLRGLRIDLVHMNNTCDDDHDLLVGAALAGIPCIAHQRGFAPAVGWKERMLARRFSAIISISDAVTADLRAKRVPMRRVTRIHDGIDPARIRKEAISHGMHERLGIPVGVPVIGVVGNIKAWKGQATLIRAMGDIVKMHPDTRCIVVGSVVDQDYFAQMNAVAVEGGYADRVIYTGYERMPAACMSIMDVVVHTSVAPEPFGLVILEGMALGKPVVATAHGGPLDIVIDGVTGRLTTPGDEHGLAAAISGLLSDDNLRSRLGQAGRARLNTEFTAARNARRIEEVYASSLAP